VYSYPLWGGRGVSFFPFLYIYIYILYIIIRVRNGGYNVSFFPFLYIYIYIYIIYNNKSTERRVFYHPPYFKNPIFKSFFFPKKKVKKGNHA
jgi:hypothetical protein